MGLDIYLEWDNMTEAEDKARYTDFANAGTVGYLRSSYNDAGFNHWAQTYIGGKDFYWIFQPHDEGAGFRPDWDACLARAEEALAEAERVGGTPGVVECLPAYTVYPNAESALKAFQEANAKYANAKYQPFRWYSNHQGEFFPQDPPKVLAVMAIKSLLGGSQTVLITEPTVDQHDYYINILKKDVPAFIKLGKEKNARVIWSG